MRYLAGVASVLVAAWFSSDAALACACCSNRAERYVGVETLGESRLGVLEQMTFAEDAFLADSAADHPVELRNLDTPLRLTVGRTPKEMVFSFRDRQGRTTVLTLAIPATISIFVVDPRGGTRDDGLGPVLYKEWQLTGHATATGVFRPLVEKSRTVSLILHGRGRGCTEAVDFTDWTLLVGGPSAKFTLYGALTSAR
jgi:hypothetical protein